MNDEKKQVLEVAKRLFPNCRYIKPEEQSKKSLFEWHSDFFKKLTSDYEKRRNQSSP